MGFRSLGIDFCAALLALSLVLCLQTVAWGNTFGPAASMHSPRAWHTSTPLNNGKVLVAGGFDAGYNYLATAELYDPASNSWSAAGAMTVGRIHHTATQLPNGKVLVVGGIGNNSNLATAELYDPATNNWSTAGSMGSARSAHTATLLPNGKVLVAGGYDGSGWLATAELYDPASNSWTTAGAMEKGRCIHTATLLADGKVLVAGGRALDFLASTELYDPASNSWSAAGTMVTARSSHTATLLPDGKVLVAGGCDDNNIWATAELYDPASNGWSAAGTMGTGRHSHTATLLLNGKVLVAGAYHNGSSLATAELYDPASNGWSAAGTMGVARQIHTATLLPSGRVLVAGGYDGSSIVATAELYGSTPPPPDPPPPGTDNWTTAGTMAVAREDHTATLLFSGKVLVVGGRRDGFNVLATAEIYDPTTNNWSAAGSMNTARFIHTATLLSDGKVLVVGGRDGSISKILATADLYDPATDSWTAAGEMGTTRIYHTATLLPDGKVLVVGGSNPYSLATAELYDPATNSWSAAGSMGRARANHTATLLTNGRVLVVGACSAEIYDPATNTWSTASTDLSTLNSGHIATLLPNGKVLLAGGGAGAGSFVTSLLYDPATNSWSSSDNMTSARSSAAATLLMNGLVLVAGGVSGNDGIYALSTAELYDPTSKSWLAEKSMSTTRVGHTATRLATGQVLVVGGHDAAIHYLATAELYTPGLRAIISGIPAGRINAAGIYELNVGGYEIIAYKWRLNGGAWSEETPISTTFKVATNNDGDYTVEVVGRDAFGNWQDIAFCTRVRWTLDTQAPGTTISDKPPLRWNDRTPNFSFSSEAGAVFECKLDSGDYVACTSAYTVAVPLDDGSHTFMVRARDLAGNYDPTPDSYSWWTVGTLAVDTTIADRPTPHSNEVMPSFSFSSEPGATFECKLDLGAYAACSSPYTVAVPLGNGSHTFKVRAKVVTGEYDPTPASYTWVVDTVPPALTIRPVTATNMAMKVITGTKAAGSRLTANAPDGVTCTFSTGSTSAATSWSCTVSGYPVNQLTSLHITATNAVGNSTTRRAVITYDTLAPAATITGTPASPIKAGTYRLTVGGDQVTAYRWRLNGGLWSGVTPVTTRIGVIAAASRMYTVEVIGRDAAGNWQDKTSATAASWTVDALAPATTLLDKPPLRSGDTMPSFSFGSEEGATFECKLDLGAYTACTSTFTVAVPLGNGSHTFKVRARDLAGNYDPTPAGYTWTVDAALPVSMAD